MSVKKVVVSEHQQMVVDILKAGDWLDNKVSKLLKGFNLTHVQFNILRILRGAYPEPLSVGEVKNRVLFSNSDITRLVDRLVSKGFVLRKICDNNRRKMDIIISDDGLVALEEIDSRLTVELEHFFENKVSVEEAIMVSEVLKKIQI